MKPYVVEMTIRSVVMAEDEDDAYRTGADLFREIARDEAPDVDVLREVLDVRHLPTGWDLMCLPYGGDGNTRLKDLVADQSA